MGASLRTGEERVKEKEEVENEIPFLWDVKGNTVNSVLHLQPSLQNIVQILNLFELFLMHHQADRIKVNSQDYLK